MPSRLDDLDRLARLLDEGKITSDEYDDLKAELLLGTQPAIDHSGREPQGSGSAPDVKSHSTPVQTVHEEPTFAPMLYRVAFGLGIGSIFLGGFIGLFAWGTIAVSGWALYSLRSKQRRWMAWTGLTLGILFSLSNAYLNGHLDGLLAIEENRAPVSTSPIANPELETIGLSVEEFIETWNSVATASDTQQVMLRDIDHGDREFTSAFDNTETAFIQVFHYGTDQVAFLHFEGKTQASFDLLLRNACQTIVNRPCADELVAAWDMSYASGGKIIWPSDVLLEGNCWTYVKQNPPWQEVRIAPLDASCSP